MMALEKLTVNTPGAFDPANQAMVQAMLQKIAEVKGPGWEVNSYDPAARKLTVTRGAAITEIDTSDAQATHLEVSLGSDVRATDGEKHAQRLENIHPGYYLTEFRPFVGTARLSKMTPEELRCREAVANALGVPRWEVQVTATPDGGFGLQLPAKYSPSAHDKKLQEVAEQVVGRPGWYAEVDTQSLQGRIVPALPPTFPVSIPYPFELMPKPSPLLPPIPIGHLLPEFGDQPSEMLMLDFQAAPHGQISGTAGAGKSVTLNAIIAGVLASGAELVVIDVPAKAVDFEQWRPFVRPGGWGGESYQENAVALENIYREGERRAGVFKQYGAKKLSELPDDLRATMPEVVIIVDEVTGLFAMDSVPKRLDANDPLRVEAESKNYARELIKTYIEKIAAEQRFVGFHLLLSTQVASVNTGVGTALRSNLQHKLLLGARATEGNRKLILSDVSSVPEVPNHVKEDPQVSRGVGVCELAGVRPGVFKSFYASDSDLIRELVARGIKQHPADQVGTITRPNPADVAARFPELARLAATPEPRGFGHGERAYEPWELDPDGVPLTGFQRANAAKAEATRVARETAHS